MPATIFEKFLSRAGKRGGKNDSTDIVYIISGTNDDTAVKALLLAEPDTYDGLVRQGVSFDPIGDSLWEGTVSYGPLSPVSPPETGDSRYSFEIGSGTQHITQSKRTVAAHTPPDADTSINFQGAIGVTRDSVEGVDIYVSAATWTETHYIAADLVTNAYKLALLRLGSKTNDAPFRGAEIGEVLFQGCSGAPRPDHDDFEITFRFAFSENKTGLEVGEIVGIEKGGWEYLWVFYEDAEGAFRMIKRPVQANVEQVYDEDDFSIMGIGTT